MDSIHIITFRIARIEDVNMLLTWRNDPETRKSSITTDTVDRDEHVDWFAKSLSSKERTIYIAEIMDTPVGTIRDDLVGDKHFLSWTIASEKRNQGMGKVMLRKFFHKYRRKFFSQIKMDNLASISIAESAGMKFARVSDGLLTYIYDF